MYTNKLLSRPPGGRPRADRRVPARPGAGRRGHRLVDSPAGESIARARGAALRVRARDPHRAHRRRPRAHAAGAEPAVGARREPVLAARQASPSTSTARGSRGRGSALRGVELGPLDLDIALPKYVPDFAAPIPIDPLPTLADEIEAVRATDPATRPRGHRRVLGRRPAAAVGRLRSRRPREMADRLADAMHAYWDAALADDWPRLRAVLEGEMLGRARALALSGPGAVLEELHPSVRWRDPVIELVKDKEYDMHLGGARSCSSRSSSPAACSWATPRTSGGGDRLPGARHGGAVGARARPSFDGRLELLLGHGRAAVLRALDRPATTTELARRLSYAPSTVSAHLDVLSRAGPGRAPPRAAQRLLRPQRDRARRSWRCWPTSPTSLSA